MAFPATPLATFINGSSPACDAGFLNNLQSGINKVCVGTVSFVALTCDGVGAQTVVPVSGALTLSATASGTSTPTPTISKGVYYKEMAPLAMGAFRNTAGTYTLDWGVGITSFSKGSTGIVNITMITAVSSITTGMVIATVNMTPGGGTGVTCRGLLGGGGATAQVQILDNTSAFTDQSFYFVVYGS